MGFGLPALVGVRASYAVVAATSAVAGIVALAVAGRDPRRVTARAAEAPARLARCALRVAAGAGMLGLGLEVLWTRLFARCCTTRCTRSRP